MLRHCRYDLQQRAFVAQLWYNGVSRYEGGAAMTTIKKTVRKKKRKVGRPAFSRNNIPEGFFRYYDAYRFGFWNKREFSEYLGSPVRHLTAILKR